MTDNWEHAAENSAKCYEVGISALRERLEASRVVINDCVLYCEDAEFVLPTLVGKNICATVTDPPYGINKDGQKKTTGGHGGRKAYEFLGWDSQRPDQNIFDLILKTSKHQIIWGGNYFADFLPARGKWLVWDKGQRIYQSDGELAYTSMDGALRIFNENRVFLLLEGAEHPTQKPIKLMKWCIQHLPADVETILDPFMGSGTTGVAAVKLGKRFIGIERERKYFDIAVKRITEAYKQPDLFVAPPENKPEQMTLLGSDR